MTSDKRNLGKFFRQEWPTLLILIGTFAVSALLYPALPEKIPMHWNVQGQVDKYSDKLAGAFQIPSLNLALYILFFVIAKVDPRRDNYAKFASAYRIMRMVIIAFLAGMQILVLLSSLGYALDIGRIVRIGIGLLFIVFGNFMGQIRNNYFVGIRNPWTLSNEDVWRKTHRLASFIWVLGGILMVITSPMEGYYAVWLLGIILGGMILIPYGYSYYTYTKLDK